MPGGTADVAGETISYTITVTNTGNAAIAGVTVTDAFAPGEASVLSGGINVGDTDGDGLLDVGETWTYTASHQVTQAELDSGADLVNVATASGAGVAPASDGATVAVTQNKSLNIVKDADVRVGRRRGRRDPLHDGGDQYGQRGDCRRDRDRCVHDRRGAGSVWRL